MPIKEFFDLEVVEVYVRIADENGFVEGWIDDIEPYENGYSVSMMDGDYLFTEYSNVYVYTHIRDGMSPKAKEIFYL